MAGEAVSNAQGTTLMTPAIQIFAESIDDTETTRALPCEFVQTIAPERLHFRDGFFQSTIDFALWAVATTCNQTEEEGSFSPEAELIGLTARPLVFSEVLVDEARKALTRQSENLESDDEWANRLGAELGSFQD
jgi:hypothetical protein